MTGSALPGSPARRCKKHFRWFRTTTTTSDVYKPDVIDSKLLSHQGNDFKIYLRLLKKKIITVVLDTDHDVHYSPLGPTRWFLRSYTTRISEVENAGKPNEKVAPPDTGYGFLWRLDSYWRFEERDGGVYVEAPSHFAHARRTRRTGMDYRTDRAEIAQAIVDQHSRGNTQGAFMRGLIPEGEGRYRAFCAGPLSGGGDFASR